MADFLFTTAQDKRRRGQALRGSREWSDRELGSALSEEALTAAVMQRYHPYKAVKRELGTAIGSLNPR
jgi:hypothetical protein